MNPGIGFPDEFEDRRKVSVEKYVCREGGRGAEEGCGADGGIGRRRGTRARRRSRGRSRRRNMVGRSRWVLVVEAGEWEGEDKGAWVEKKGGRGWVYYILLEKIEGFFHRERVRDVGWLCAVKSAGCWWERCAGLGIGELCEGKLTNSAISWTQPRK